MWTTPIEEWDWISERLGLFAMSVTSVVPAGRIYLSHCSRQAVGAFRLARSFRAGAALRGTRRPRYVSRVPGSAHAALR
jgi:hypothetical protein